MQHLITDCPLSLPPSPWPPYVSLSLSPSPIASLTLYLRGVFNQGYMCSKCGLGAHKECLGRFGGCGKTGDRRTNTHTCMQSQTHAHTHTHKHISTLGNLEDYVCRTNLYIVLGVMSFTEVSLVQNVQHRAFACVVIILHNLLIDLIVIDSLINPAACALQPLVHTELTKAARSEGVL